MNHFLSLPPTNDHFFWKIAGVPRYTTATFIHLINPHPFKGRTIWDLRISPNWQRGFANSFFCSRLYILNNAQIMSQCDFVIWLMKNPNSNVTSSRKPILIPSLERTSLGLVALTLLASSLSLPPHCKPFLYRQKQLSSFPPLLTGQAQPDSWQAFNKCQLKELNCQVQRMNRR